MTDVRINQVPMHSRNGFTVTPDSSIATWVATLSDGNTAVENAGQWTLNSGESLPWTRLCYYLADSNLHLTSLRLNIKGRTIHMPRAKMDRFGFKGLTPERYSLSYKVEAEMDLGGGPTVQQIFVALAAHYPNFVVHYVQDATVGNDSWIIVTDPYSPLAGTPHATV